MFELSVMFPSQKEKTLYLCGGKIGSGMELRKTFQSVIALHQDELPLMLNKRETELPVDSARGNVHRGASCLEMVGFLLM